MNNTQINNFLKICVCSFVMFTGMTSLAQQDPHYTQYIYNMMAFNPAYAGSTGNIEASLLHRSQWAGIDGAPKTQSFNLHSPLINDKMGLGLNIVNDEIGPSSELYLNGNFSYTLQLNANMQLALGAKAGMNVINIDWTKGRYYDTNDVLLNSNINDRITANFGAGGFLYSQHWYLGFSVPNFVKSDYYDDIQEAVLADRLHYFITGGYVFDISENLKFKPAFLTKIVSGSPLSVDVSANFLIGEIVTLGASYRWDDSVSAIAGLNFLETFFVGYAFDYTTSSFNKYNDGSHEIILRYRPKSKSNRVKSPRFF
ncbi:type IX secretion system membrane protein PorP/SprF [Mesonia sp. K7]|uniref:PorP/SprF family type IX secretion system membrane protein n=1 Tax=Mesonia sp. K7 TaxID=2218606 RepID=UPI000DA91516|nr:type IX secretion system membrane protein PorP/SprF [Mesonia sp. K7]PZD77139.1 hypothetical protein DNG35_09855 [Mesonia sp. K7]